MHYKNYRVGGDTFQEDTVDVHDGVNEIPDVYLIWNDRSSYMDIEFFDIDGNKFLPSNVEYIGGKNKLTKAGGGIFTILTDGTVRILLTDQLYDNISEDIHPGKQICKLEWDDILEEIDNRKIIIALIGK